MQTHLISQAQWASAINTVRPKGMAPTVWVDIGTSFRSLASWDVESNTSLLVIGVDALRTNLEDHRQAASKRFVRVEGACSASGKEGRITFYKHRSPTCGTLLATRDSGPVLGTGGDACTGDVPKQLIVRQFTLRNLLSRIRALANLRVQLLKIDIQGSGASAGLDPLFGVLRCSSCLIPGCLPWMLTPLSLDCSHAAQSSTA